MKRLGKVLIVLGIIAALVVGAEFAVRYVVQSQAQKAIQNVDLDLTNPTMNLGGGSVLAAVAQGRFVDVSGTADAVQVPFKGHKVPVNSITYNATDIRLVSASEAVIGTLELTGTLDYAGLSTVAGLPISSGGEGRVLVTYSVDILGLNSLDIGISGVPVLDVPGQQVELEQSRIEVAGITLTDELSQQIIDRVVKPISLAADERVTVNSIAVQPNGLQVNLTATEIPVRR